jgi:DNA-binding response OmpR family regulator
MAFRILLIEDEAPLAAALRQGLADAGFDVEICPSAEHGFVRLEERAFDLLILDIGLPGRSGFEVLPLMRRRWPQLLVLIATAFDAIDDRVRGLATGADDYLVKPIALAELVARVHALARRNRNEVMLRVPGLALEIDLLARHATVAQGVRLDLTAREFDLLAYLTQHAGRAVTRDMIVRDVWKLSMRNPSIDNVIDVHVARLRRKLAAAGLAEALATVRGVGFSLGESAAMKLR